MNLTRDSDKGARVCSRCGVALRYHSGGQNGACPEGDTECLCAHPVLLYPGIGDLRECQRCHRGLMPDRWTDLHNH